MIYLSTATLASWSLTFWEFVLRRSQTPRVGCLEQMGSTVENAERAAGERFMPGEAPYREPTPLVPPRSEGTSPECGRQPARYPSAYMPFPTPPEQKEAAATNDQRD